MNNTNTTLFESNFGKKMVWINLFIGCIGTFLNFISVFVILKGKLKNITIFRYLVAVSIADFFVTSSAAFRVFIFFLRERMSFNSYSFISCNLNPFTAMSAFGISSFCLITVTFDRFLCISFPTKAKIWSSLKICNGVILSIVIIFLGFNLIILFANNEAVKVTQFYVTCLPSGKIGEYVLKYHFVIFAILYSYLPFVILSILNILIVINLRKHTLIMNDKNEDKQKKKMQFISKKLTIMNLTLTFSFLIFTSPLCIYDIYILSTVKYLKMTPLLYQINEILISVTYVNHVLNIFLYCLCGKTFRQQLFQCFSFKLQSIVT